MITAYTGLPGAGKSYGVVAHVILPALKAGRDVYTNIPLYPEEFAKAGATGTITPVDIDDYAKGDKLFADIPGGALIVLDELWGIWPSGMKTTAVSDDHKEFLAKHRHRVGGEQNRAQEVVLVTQDLGQVASFVRQLIERTTVTRKLDALGAEKSAVTHIYRGVVQGDRQPKDRLIRTLNFRYSPDVYRLYQSATSGDAEVEGAGDESRTDGRGNVLKRPAVVIGALLVIVGIPWAATQAVATLGDPGQFAGGSASPEPEPDPEPPTVVEVDTLSTPPPQPRRQRDQRPPPEPQGPQISGRFRLVGTMWRKGEEADGIAMLQSSSGVQRIPLSKCERNDVGQWSCLYRGQRVTEWSGSGNWSPGVAAPAHRTGDTSRASAASPRSAPTTTSLTTP